MDISFLNENEGLRAEIQIIKSNILIILDEVHHNRYYINKHFQNCMINYFLRNLNFPFLSQVEPRYTCSKTMNNAILQKYVNSEGAIYLRLMKGYLHEIQNQGKLQLYRETLVQMIMQEIPCTKFYKGEQKEMTVADLKSNKEYQSEIWKKAFSLFVLFHSYNQNIKGIFEIWNSLFPQDQIKRKRKQNINHIIVIPTRNQSSSIETKSEVVSPVKEQDEEEQEIAKQNIQFYQSASQGFQFFGLNNDNINNNVNNNQNDNRLYQEDYSNNNTNNYYFGSFEENLYFSYPTMCSTHNFFSNNSGDSPLLSSSDSQDIKEMYEDQINASPQNDQNQSSGEYDEIQSELPFHSKHVYNPAEGDNLSIQVSKKSSSKGKRRRCAFKETGTFDPHSLGRKIIKKQEQNKQNSINLPSYLSECSLPMSKETASLESINLISFSSSDLTNQPNQGSKKEFTTC